MTQRTRINKEKREVYVVDGSRTPFLKAGKPNSLTASDLAVATLKPLLARQPFKLQEIEEVVVGCGAPLPDEMNIGRIIALRAGCGYGVMGWTVQRNCGSGMQAIDSAAGDIASGRHDLVLAGGTECMSRAPLLFPPEMASWLIDVQSSKTFLQKLKTSLKFRPHFLKPTISLLLGLTDPVVNLSMGQTAENLAYEFNISREAMDRYAEQSHLRALNARDQGLLNEITPVYDWQGGVIASDTGVRQDSTLEKLGKLKAVFDKPFGLVTAGNSSQITDGAAFVILASHEVVKHYNLPVLGKIVDVAWSALDPAIMGLGPALAIQALLSKQGLSIQDIDYWEMNEAFAAQVLACLKYLEREGVGTIPLEKLNVDGGAIAIGHPIGASGARLILHLLQVLKRNNKSRGIASLCIGGGQGGATLIESMACTKSREDI